MAIHSTGIDGGPWALLLSLTLIVPCARAAQEQEAQGPEIRSVGELCAPKEQRLGSQELLCRLARDAERVFQVLGKAAGLGREEISFRVRMSRYINAFYADRHKEVRVNQGLLFALEGKQEALLFTLAHEIGHALQGREGIVMSDVLTRGDYAFKQVEGQADIHAAQVLAQAGYSVDSARKGFEDYFECTGVRSGAAMDGPHPTDRDRWTNLLMSRDAVRDKVARVAAELGSGTASSSDWQTAADPGRPFAAAVGIQELDRMGRLRLGALAGRRNLPAREIAAPEAMGSERDIPTQTLSEGQWARRLAARSCGAAPGLSYHRAVLNGALRPGVAR